MRLIHSLIGISLLIIFDYAIAANTINGPRKALVIGNANYPQQGLFTKLTNPVNDATGVAQRLRDYGFVVTRVVNVGPTAMKHAINTFVNSLDKSDIALVYYSGHGIVAACYEGEEQKNYLLPIQQVFTGRADICEYGVSAQWVLNRLTERDGGTNMLLLDSCRNVIAANNKGLSNKGFVEMHGTGTFIGYASAPGQTAKGDDESNYSVFTGQLLEVLQAPNDKLPLELLFKRVRTAVADLAENAGIQQVPWSDNGLVGEEDFCFSSPCVGLTDGAVESAAAAKIRELEEQLNAANAKIKEMPIEPPKSVVVDYSPRQAFEPEMVDIPAGSFKMGSPSNEEGRYDDEGPVHTVHVKAFQMGKYEITRGQFRAFVNASGYKTEAETGDGCYGWTGSTWDKKPEFNWRNVGFEQNDKHPVVCVSWNDSQKYIEWLNNETGKNYRLPTEAEWEYAARAGTSTRFSFGNDDSDLGSYAWFSANSDETHPVGAKLPNPWGLYDMHGNVWEWNQDQWHNNYSGAPTDGSAWEAGDSNAHLLRGGSWHNSPDNCRSAVRSDSDLSSNNLGVRVVAVVSP